MRLTNVVLITVLLPLDLGGPELLAQIEMQDTITGIDESARPLSGYISWLNNTKEGATAEQTLTNLEFFGWLQRAYGMQLDVYALFGNADGPISGEGREPRPFRNRFPNGFDPIYERARSLGIRLGWWTGRESFSGTQREPLAETYIDVFMTNDVTAPHHRAAALRRGPPRGLTRQTAGRGVSLSSSLDFWADDLVLQAFNRTPIPAPELYGNPWLLRDDEFHRLARIFTLHREYRDILVNGAVLPAERYGPDAVSRGDATTRLVTLRNLSWQPVAYTVKLDESLGLAGNEFLHAWSLHPTERILGRFEPGDSVTVEVLPFRAYLLLVTGEPIVGVGIRGTDFHVLRDELGGTVALKLLGQPGDTVAIQLDPGGRRFRHAELDGQPLDDLAFGDTVEVVFPGAPLERAWHRKLAEPERVQVPADAEALYEATVYAADNNALEVRSLERSGPTNIEAVAAARDAFFGQTQFIARGAWDRFVFDSDSTTYMDVWSSGRDLRIDGGVLRVDFGSPILVDRVLIRTLDSPEFGRRVSERRIAVEASADLRTWTSGRISELSARSIDDSIAGRRFPVDLPPGRTYRYLRIDGGPERVTEIEGYRAGRRLERIGWRASNLFGPYEKAPAIAAWSANFVLEEAAPGSYLAIAVNGVHGAEKAFATIRVNGGLVGAPDRAPSYPRNTWAHPVQAVDANYTYYVPVTPEMVGAEIEAAVLALEGGGIELEPEVWITAYPIPLAERELVLYP
ncbi:MAG: DUF3999 domain-containing protein [Gemmatimonadetes bacterium]|uniref:DUF3999 domain-containing protein n=1 Tax=Candidatus Kutchimonas denitrificans TaxID=3056748 RepID=A0AAE5CD37_9BACT|nr:DUF3999 domain-containing protein [Gemmatimonadota bacterium]NIR75044.1 DUF3999 domain-containing protein [Candidatus Kutchimonas denitrificans]NIS02864.1 DUF3999 domain-containing protein [Gemmatimonadota bacterium]NIT68569.1 DUF3999 domain-containing protein [Gemmatimonadota bacterium]NIU52814.1 hypothetical protein [Gemmatimonadota bacterium]